MAHMQGAPGPQRPLRVNPCPIVITNANILDVVHGSLSANRMEVRIEAGMIACVGHAVVRRDGDMIVDACGATLMPGLIDMHVHVTAWSANFRDLTLPGAAYTTARAKHVLEGMLMRGFTSVRDAGGADFGLARAVEEGWLRGPRLFYCGHAISQTGGHGDLRQPGMTWWDVPLWSGMA